MNFPSHVCIGEALTDMHQIAPDEWHSRVGGSTWNVARALAKLGVASGFAGAISQDSFGQSLWQASIDAGIDLRLIQRYDKSPLLAMVERPQPPSYFFIGDDSADLYFDPAAMPAGWRDTVRWAHFGGISLARQPLANRLLQLARELKLAGVKISYDPNFRNLMDQHYDATLAQMCGLADVIKVSDEDCRGLMRINDTYTAFTQLRQLNPQACYFFTAGADGGALYVGEQSWQCSAPAVKVIDTVGAGDASIAGLLYSLTYQPGDYAQHLAFAIASGSAACLHAGARAPDLHEIKQLLAVTRCC